MIRAYVKIEHYALLKQHYPRTQAIIRNPQQMASADAAKHLEPPA